MTRHRSGTVVPLEAVRRIVRGPFYKQTLRRINRGQYEELAAKLRV